jgi:hypothetical protein
MVYKCGGIKGWDKAIFKEISAFIGGPQHAYIHLDITNLKKIL